MGTQNLTRVLLAQPPIRLPGATVMCLVLMARVAHDDRPLYWGGHEWLALNLGYAAGPHGLRKVRRHIQALEAAGYVKRLSQRKQGRYVYELHLPG